MAIKIVTILIFGILFLPVFSLAAGQIDINSATLEQLDQLAGIGPKYAQAIIDGRPYSSVDDLEKVKGIGPKTVAKIKEQGMACVNCAAADEKHETSDIAPAVVMSDVNATYPTGVFINELLPNPAGSDETDEWFELYNSNSFEVDLSGWKIKDATGTATTFTIPNGTRITANGYLIFKRPETKIMLNNDEDGLSLLSPDGKTQDSINFSKAPLGQSYAKGIPGMQWSTTLTPGASNIITFSITNKTSSKSLSKTQKPANIITAEAGLADISQGITNQDDSKNTSPWFLFFIALATTLILAALVLFIKFKLNKTNVRT